MPGPFVYLNAATAVATFPVTLNELAKDPKMSHTVAVHTFRSFADVVSVCTRCIRAPSTRHGFFLPCFTYWMGIASNCDYAVDERHAHLEDLLRRFGGFTCSSPSDTDAD